MSWCDKLASTPAVGFKFDFHFGSSQMILSAMSPILDKWIGSDDRPLFKVEKHNPNAFELSTDDGFIYGVDSSRAHITFNHIVRAKSVSGGPPVMQMLSQPRPYTELLPEVSRRLLEVTLLIPSPKGRMLYRVGIVATTLVAESELPPGLVRFIQYLGRPWKGALEGFNGNITTQVDANQHWNDRCIHTVTTPENPEELLTLRFDWQRSFAKGKPMDSESLDNVLRDAQRSAIDYFEDLAEGNRFDESIISAST